MRKHILLMALLFVLPFSIIACSSQGSNQSNYSEQMTPSINLEDYYKESIVKTGFSEDFESNLNETYWIIKIFNLFNEDVPGKSKIREWLNTIDIDEMTNEDETDMRSYLEGNIIKLIYIQEQVGFKSTERAFIMLFHLT